MRNVAKLLLALALAALLVVGVSIVGVAGSPWWLLYFGAPIALAVALVVARRYSPLKAAVVGAFVSLGIALVAVLPGLFVRWLNGDYESGPDCDGFCTSNDGGFALALFILGFVIAAVGVAGGIVSAIASLAGVRPSPDADVRRL